MIRAATPLSQGAVRRHSIYDIEQMTGALHTDGFALATAALTPKLCDEARAKIDGLRAEHWDEVHAQGGGRHLDRYLCVFNRDPFWLEFLDRPGIIDVAEAALGPDCHIIGETAWRSHPGYDGDPLHLDYLPITWMEGAVPASMRMPVFILTAHFYLCDVTPELAPTHVLPGSHRAGRAPHSGESSWNGREALPVLARAGECLLFRSDVWHSGSANRSAQHARYLLQVHYGRREMAQHFSPYLDWRFNPAVVAAAIPRRRRLLGNHEPGAYD
ncbi:MAG: phytanoyl-CoA dioxygenase family protein [Burkholderiales bacterium]